MKINKFFAAALAATTLLASCSKEDGGNGENTLSGEETYAGISILLKESGASVRAVSDQAGTTNEQKIDDITVYVIDNSTNEMQVKTFAGTDFGTADGDGYRAATAAMPTTVGDKTVYVVANATANLKAALSTAAAVKTNALALDETDFFTFTGASFDGTPAKLTNVVMSGKSANVTIDKKTAAQAIAAPVKVDISRNVAKIATKWASSPTMTGGALSNAEFALAAKAKKSYLTAQTNTALYTLPAAPIAATYFSDNFSARENTLTYQAVNAAGTGVNDARAWFALEHKPEAFLMGNSTMIVVKGTWAPAAGTVVTAYNSANPDPITLGNLTAGASFWVNKSTQAIWNKTAHDAAVASPNYDDTDFSLEYKNAVGYYQVNIKSGDVEGVRGVLRNNYYEMTINSITGPGDPTETGGTDPKDPNAEESNIAVSIKPINWTFNSWSENLQ